MQEKKADTKRDGADAEMVAAARVLYFWHNGRNHKRIEREMRELGFRSFRRNRLYERPVKNGVLPGWPELYGWRNEVIRVRPKRKLKRHTRKKAPARVTPDLYAKWLRTTFPEWSWGWKYQLYLYKKLARVTAGRCRRLMIFMPPRHGKSETVTIRYTAWRVLLDPSMNVIVGSYNQRLANKFSRRIRRLVEEGILNAETQRLERESAKQAEGITTKDTEKASKQKTHKGVTLARSVAEWETGGGGTVRAVGVGAGIAGFGAGLVVIDDPVRNRAAAESESNRDKVWDWFNDDVYTRLEPNAAIILIQTRWHEDDLAGRLLREMEDGGEEWEVVRLPALAEDHFTAEAQSRGDNEAGENGELIASESQRLGVSAVKNPSDPLGRNPGEALCPERYDVKALERTRKKLGSYSFAALYQQDPVPAKNVKFKREWFRQIVDEAPEGLRWKRGYDLAVSLKTSADYTASFRCAYDGLGNLYIADGFRARIEYPDQRRYIVDRMAAERDTEHGIEAALHGKALIQDLRRDRCNRAYAFKEIKVATDKLTRALAWMNMAEAGKLFLVRGSWIDEFVEEVAQFPHGKHDDQVDAVSIAVSMLAKKEYRSTGMLIK